MSQWRSVASSAVMVASSGPGPGRGTTRRWRSATCKAVVLALVVTELLTIAVKHAYRGASGPINVTVGRGPSGGIRISVAGQGTGRLQEERPGGFGWWLTRTLVAQVRGEIAFQDNRPGTRVVLTVPLPALFEGHSEADGELS